MELVTVYIPTFNRLPMLKRALNSVFSQTYNNIEVIVVDDGSTDGTREYLESIKRKGFVCIFNDANMGPCVSRNKAIAIAKGKYITGLDDDDEFLSEHIRTLIDAFEERFSLVTSSLLEVTSKGTILRSSDAGVHDISSLMHYNKLTNQALTLTERLRCISGFDEKLPAMQDYDVWVRLVNAYGPALRLSSATYMWHTEHEVSRISSSLEKRARALDLFFRKHSHLMGRSHKNSFFILSKHMLREPVSFIELVFNINIYNWRMALNLYVGKRMPLVKNIYSAIRSNCRCL